MRRGRVRLVRAAARVSCARSSASQGSRDQVSGEPAHVLRVALQLLGVDRPVVVHPLYLRVAALPDNPSDRPIEAGIAPSAGEPDLDALLCAGDEVMASPATGVPYSGRSTTASIAWIESHMGRGCGRESDSPSIISNGVKPYFA